MAGLTDPEMLDLAGYTYGRHYVENSSETPELVYPQAGTYYRLVTRASHDADRRDRCIELVRDGSPLISSNSAAVGAPPSSSIKVHRPPLPSTGSFQLLTLRFWAACAQLSHHDPFLSERTE